MSKHICIIWTKGDELDVWAIAYKMFPASINITWLYSLPEDIASITDKGFDLIIIKKNFIVPNAGLDFCRQLRAINTNIPLIIGWIDGGCKNRDEAIKLTNYAWSIGINGVFGRVNPLEETYMLIMDLLSDPSRTELLVKFQIS